MKGIQPVWSSRDGDFQFQHYWIHRPIWDKDINRSYGIFANKTEFISKHYSNPMPLWTYNLEQVYGFLTWFWSKYSWLRQVESSDYTLPGTLDLIDRTMISAEARFTAIPTKDT